MVPVQSGAQPDRIGASINGACVDKTVPRFKNGGRVKESVREQIVPHKTVHHMAIGAPVTGAL
jgi:hypothetical protein